MKKCKYCDQEKKNDNSLRNHERLCKLNPNRQKTFFENLEWQKEKVKKHPGKFGGSNQYLKAKMLNLEKPIMSEESRKKMSDAAKKQTWTEERKKKQSEDVKKRNFGGVTQSRWIKYNGKTLGSFYELELVKNLEANGILWDTCKRFNYVDPFGKCRTYTPDIFLTEFNVFLDPKNDFLMENINPSLGFSDLEKIKLVENQNNIRVLVLNKNQLNWESIQKLL